jgi:hypothetical protein
MVLLQGGVLSSCFMVLGLLVYVSLSSPRSIGWSWLSGWGRYLESELSEHSTSLRVLDSNITRSLVSLYWVMYIWGIMLILQTLLHLFTTLGILVSLPFHISYWLFGSALGLLLCVYVCVGWEMLCNPVDRGLRDNFYLVGNPVLGSRLYYRMSALGGVYNRSMLTGLLDVWSVSSIVRGLYPLLGWLYQVSYFGVRLFLVFVLHAFCLSCFGELYTSCTDKCMLIAWPVGGFMGLGMALSLLMVLYLFIQIYVYISFTLSFVYKNLLSYFRMDTASWLDSRGPSHWLVPVSLVDLLPSHYYMWLMVWLMGTVLTSRVWMTVYSSRSVYAKLSSETRGRITRPVSRLH